MRHTIFNGDVLTCLKSLPECSVQCVVTSPPYWGLRDYGMPGQIGLEPTPEEYVEKMVDVFHEVRRVLRDDGALWLNLGDTFADKNLVGIPWRTAFALQADRWYLRSDIIWSKPNPMPESVTDRPTKSHEYVFLLTKSSRYFYDADAVREGSGIWRGTDFLPTSDKDRAGNGKTSATNASFRNRTDAARIGRNRRTVWEIATQPTPEAHFATFPEALVEPCIKAGTSERGCCPECGAPWRRIVESGGGTAEASWQPTCTCDIMGTVPCVVLDPFGGSGTVAKVARDLGRSSILIELNPEYVGIAKKRLRIGEQLDSGVCEYVVEEVTA